MWLPRGSLLSTLMPLLVSLCLLAAFSVLPSTTHSLACLPSFSGCGKGCNQLHRIIGVQVPHHTIRRGIRSGAAHAIVPDPGFSVPLPATFLRSHFLSAVIFVICQSSLRWEISLPQLYHTPAQCATANSLMVPDPTTGITILTYLIRYAPISHNGPCAVECRKSSGRRKTYLNWGISKCLSLV